MGGAGQSMVPPALKRMVREQLLRGGIRSRRVVAAFMRVDRALFVPETARERAYADGPLSIGFGQTISQPLMVAEMLEVLDIHMGHTFLEVGSGSGYALALAAALGAKAHGIERIAELAETIAGRFAKIGFSPPAIKVGDGSGGWPEEAPFERILVSAACPEVPSPLLGQLSEGGVLVAPVGERGVQLLHRAEKRGGRVITSVSTPCVFVPLIGEHGYSG